MLDGLDGELDLHLLAAVLFIRVVVGQRAVEGDGFGILVAVEFLVEFFELDAGDVGGFLGLHRDVDVGLFCDDGAVFEGDLHVGGDGVLFGDGGGVMPGAEVFAEMFDGEVESVVGGFQLRTLDRDLFDRRQFELGRNFDFDDDLEFFAILQFDLGEVNFRLANGVKLGFLDGLFIGLGDDLLLDGAANVGAEAFLDEAARGAAATEALDDGVMLEFAEGFFELALDAVGGDFDLDFLRAAPASSTV